jgi:hypothetical protein
MANLPHKEYETYREIMSELLSPISAAGLDDETLCRLYKSKLVYLENIRVKCFKSMNNGRQSPFCYDDYVLILRAIQENTKYLRSVIMLAISSNLAKRKV